jgi:hypothetical protein
MSTYKGYTWLVDVPDDLVEPETGELQALRDRVAVQDRELEAKNKQLSNSIFCFNKPDPLYPPHGVPSAIGGGFGREVNWLT